MELALKMGSFEELDEQEQFEVDGGAWGAKEWTACGLIVAGAGCAVVGIWCPGLWGISGKAWATAGAVLGGAGGIVAISG